MDFTVSVGAPPPVPVRINGADYKVPRFLLPEIKARAASQAEEQMNSALAQLGDEDQKARFRLYYRAPVTDVAVTVEELRSGEGVEYLLREQLPKAGVPAEIVEAMVRNGDPLGLRNLAVQITSAAEAEKSLKEKSGEQPGDGPLTGAPAT